MGDDEGQIKQIKAKREAAAKARRLSAQLTAAEDRHRVLAFAAELEAQADALRRGLSASAAPPAVTQMQMQVQQGPPQKDEEESPRK